MKSAMKNHFRAVRILELTPVPFRIVVVYLSASALWIFFSDKILGYFVTDTTVLTDLSIVKGWLFVGLTSLMLYVLIYRNASRMTHAETEARRAEAKYRQVVDTANIIIKTDLTGCITLFNQYAREFFGYGREEVLGKRMAGTIVPATDDSGSRPPEIILKMRENPKQSLNSETECIKKNGARAWIAWTNKPILDPYGRVTEILCIGTDVTQRKLAVEALHESEHRFQDILNRAPSVVYVKDLQGRYTFANYHFERLSGFRSEEILGRTDFDLFPPEVARQSNQNDRKALKMQSPLEIEEIGPVGGDMHTFISAKFPLHNARGETYAICGISTDITSRKAAEADRERLIAELQSALSKVRLLSGFLPICASCKKIRDDKGYWQQIEAYIRDHSEAEFSHGICPDCSERLYPGLHPKKP